MTYIDEICEDLRTKWEIDTFWLYRDINGNATAAVGYMLPNVDASLKLHWFCRGDTATEDQIRQDWKRVMSMPYGQRYGAWYYRSPEGLIIPKEERLSLLTNSVLNCDSFLRSHFGTIYDSFPDSIKKVLIDMVYNLGPTKFSNEYPKLNQAVRDQKWAVASTECHRIGISDERNRWAAEQFELAA